MGQYKIRQPAVAGQFYPASHSRLKQELGLLFRSSPEKTDALVAIMPHAGYIYSGEVAAAVISHIKIKDRIIMLGPNHSGLGLPFSLMASGRWRTPLADAVIDSELAACLLKNCPYLQQDDAAHLYEHCLEVQLPFLQYNRTDFRFVPVVFMSADMRVYKEIGAGIAQTIKDLGLGGQILIIASSDMTHYETQESANYKDTEAIKAILDMDEDRLICRIKELDISMCGYVPVIISLIITKILGAKGARLIKYQTSGDITGDLASVVGYAGIIIY
jgi:hypothetical protein